MVALLRGLTMTQRNRTRDRQSHAPEMLVAFVAITLVFGAFLVFPGMSIHRLARSALLALAFTGLVEVLRSYWTVHALPWSAGGMVRVLATWFGFWALGYINPIKLSGVTTAPIQSVDTVSVITAVLSFVLALTTLVATKVAADARSEVLVARREFDAARQVALVADTAALQLKLQGLTLFRIDIREKLEQESDPTKAARLTAIDKILKAIRRPTEQLQNWGSSALDAGELADQARQSTTLLAASPGWADHSRELLGRDGAEHQMRELGLALLRHLDLLRNQHPLLTYEEQQAWDAMARLARALTDV